MTIPFLALIALLIVASITLLVEWFVCAGGLYVHSYRYRRDRYPGLKRETLLLSLLILIVAVIGC